jgi:hypothetical protein
VEKEEEKIISSTQECFKNDKKLTYRLKNNKKKKVEELKFIMKMES